MSGYDTPGVPVLSYLQGTETIPLDTNYAGGITPQCAAVNASLLAASTKSIAFRNVIDGGDAYSNPWQRGTSFTGITNAVTYTADRWFALGGASSSISVSQQAVAASALTPFYKSFQFGRASSNADTAVISFAQALETLSSARLAGSTVTLSFWAKCGANFSAANSALGVILASGTAANGSAANLISGGWTGYSALTATTPTAQVYGALPNPSTSAAGTATLSTSWTRFTFTYTVPAASLQLGVVFNFTPVGTAGANDWVQFAGIQLEQGAYASTFEFRSEEVELALCQRFFFAVNEPASGTAVGVGMITTTTAAKVVIPTPVPMRAVPTVTVSSGSFALNVAGTPAATTLTVSSIASTANAITVGGSGSALTAGQATLLQSGGGAGYIYASADL